MMTTFHSLLPEGELSAPSNHQQIILYPRPAVPRDRGNCLIGQEEDS